jgi:hypothetical protein
MGDRVLSECAQLMRHSSRSQDIAVRWGGEEFLLILMAADASRAAEIAERLRGAVERFDWATLDRRLAVTLSIGLASSAGPRARRPAALLALADSRVYAAKAAGRNRVVARIDCIAPGHRRDCALPRGDRLRLYLAGLFFVVLRHGGSARFSLHGGRSPHSAGGFRAVHLARSDDSLACPDFNTKYGSWFVPPTSCALVFSATSFSRVVAARPGLDSRSRRPAFRVLLHLARENRPGHSNASLQWSKVELGRSPAG